MTCRRGYWPRPVPMSADPHHPAAVYLDSSALVKLVVAEPESPALRRYLSTVGICERLEITSRMVPSSSTTLIPAYIKLLERSSGPTTALKGVCRLGIAVNAASELV